MTDLKNMLLGLFASFAVATAIVLPASAQQPQKPNILVIMADDIGYWNISSYNRGQMGYRTPNIDRIANEGAIFTDYYGQQSCTAGRAAFITGQSPLRTGLLKVGLPAAKEGLSDKDPTIAELLKPQGYATGQFGKNHLGDLNEFLPTVHGFDVFFGNLYHLNAEEEPENPDYPKNPSFLAQFGPRGVLKCVATTTTETAGADPRFGPWGKQKCEDTGPLTRKRMETIDEEFVKATQDFIDGAVRDKKPFFVWFNPTRMHIWTHLKPSSQGKTGLGLYPDGMVEHDGQVGQLLQKLDDLGITNNTIVIYTTDNGAETFTWPDGGTTPFRGEKNTNWEGGYRGACDGALAWPGATAYRDQRDFLCRGLGGHARGGGRRAEHQGKASAGLRCRRQDVPGAPRRVRPARSFIRQRPGQAPGVLLLDGRWQPRRLALRSMEGGVHGATRRRSRCMGGAVAATEVAPGV